MHENSFCFFSSHSRDPCPLDGHLFSRPCYSPGFVPDFTLSFMLSMSLKDLTNCLHVWFYPSFHSCHHWLTPGSYFNNFLYHSHFFPFSKIMPIKIWQGDLLKAFSLCLVCNRKPLQFLKLTTLKHFVLDSARLMHLHLVHSEPCTISHTHQRIAI